ncbi:MAG: YeeE/YedE thiosulfate transporter family protein [Candidatus Neomarinimicrobiota bacterium]
MTLATRFKSRLGSKAEGDEGTNGQPQAYMNPYLAGIGLGLTLLAAFVIMGRGLGASGGYTSLVAAGVNALAPEHAAANGMYAAYLQGEGGSPLKDWLVFEILGVIVGGFISGRLAGRIKLGILKGPRISSTGRLALAFTGGALMGFAAKLARGCTSGQALTGGALLSVGGWVFMLAVFAGGYGAAWMLRRQWT